MKGAYKRYLKRKQMIEEVKSNNSIDVDKRLDRIFSSIPKTFVENDRKANLRVNNSYAIKCPDDPNYYRVVFLKRNSFTGSVQALISNSVFGVISDGIEVTTAPELYLFVKRNTNLSAANDMSNVSSDVTEKYRDWLSGDNDCLSDAK